MPLLEIESIHKDYPGFSLDVSLACEPGELVAVLGPSGSGKSTLLRILAGLVAPDRGRIVLAGRDLTGVPARRRGVGLVFQDFALFPHYDVAGNVAYGLRAQHPGSDPRAQVAALLERFALAGFGPRRIEGLSGGERQRVALARAMAVSPGLMLFDEPLGALDAALRKELREQLRRIQEEQGFTALTVTHDQEDALAIADRVVVMRDGRIVQTGTPEAVYRQPGTAFVATFFGDANLLSGEDLQGLFGVPAEPGLYCLRAEDLRSVGSSASSSAGLLDLAVLEVEYRGRDYLVRGQPVRGPRLPAPLRFHLDRRPARGEGVTVALPAGPLCRVLDDRDGAEPVR